MEALKWLIVAIVAAPFVVRIAFWAMCTAKRLRDSGIKLSLVDKLSVYIALIAGYPADILYNWTVGWVRFGELRKVTYSSRIQYYVSHDTWRYDREKQDKVTYWYQYLNVADPGHVKPKP